MLSNFWLVLTVSVLAALLVGLVARFFTRDWIPFSAIAYAVAREILGHFQKRHLERLRVTDTLSILKQYAQEKCGQVRKALRERNDGSIVGILNVLEYLLVQISRCCGGKKQVEFRRVKGLISDTKTTFDKSQHDPNIKRPYAEVSTHISTVETYLNDL